MKKTFLSFLIVIAALLIFIPLAWFFAIPDSLITDALDGFASSPEFELSAEGITKGLPFTVYADTLSFKVRGVSALKVTDIILKINPLYLFKKQMAFSIKGSLDNGAVRSDLKFPEDGYIEITNAEIGSIPYLSSLGLKGSGILWSRFDMKPEISQVRFKISKAHIEGMLPMMPLSLSAFREIQGAFSIASGIVRLNSISLDGEKGYARLKGDISLQRQVMKLTLELMPVESRLEPLETALIRKYMVSPGYYAILIEGPLSSVFH